ncbi:double zinc ribbon domain-containing protein [Stieleria sp. ICT_E10.1]|uniref:ComF family protein n=1 Tax=Stieleria sedimenti TaxID=2976331 RepID=UPI00217F9BC0|nr:double zinc ribbon domain-containing protein [Stieleria sedimenti]MCS7470362.1 double zinc ribbon domain-containing protein [Stieleria sedimenti]
MGADSSPPNAAPAARRPRLFERGARFGGQLGRQALELVLPSTCRLCDACIAPAKDFCADCRSQLESSESRMRSACLRCGHPGAGPAGANHGESEPFAPASAPDQQPPPLDRCPRCKRETYAFDGCIALWSYDGLVRSAVVAAKYGSQISLADALARRLARRIREVIEPQSDATGEAGTDIPDLITPVPSHLWRRIQRGAGGSRVLARSVTRALGQGWPNVAYADLLATTRKINKQAWLGEKERIANVNGAFCASRSPWRPWRRRSLTGKHVLLIDDVITTGATAGENAKVLKQAGARRVTVAVVARACSG